MRPATTVDPVHAVTSREVATSTASTPSIANTPCHAVDGQSDGQLPTATTIARRMRLRRIPCRSSTPRVRVFAAVRRAQRHIVSQATPRTLGRQGLAAMCALEGLDERSDQDAAVRDVSIKFVSANRFVTSREFGPRLPVLRVPGRHIDSHGNRGLRCVLGGHNSGRRRGL
jgi:hypothetical protein